MLTDRVIDGYQLGLHGQGEGRRLAIPVFDTLGNLQDIRLWLPPKWRKEGEAKIRHWEQGRGAARLFPIAQLQHDSLVLVEGELDALALISHGIPAITVTAGANVWHDELSEPFRGKTVTVLMDNDVAGTRGREKRCESLSRYDATVRVPVWPADRAVGWDVTDELQQHAVESLQAILESAEIMPALKATDAASRCSDGISNTGTSERSFELIPRSAAQLIEEAPEVVWQIEGIHPAGGSMLLAGDAGIGKTWLTLDLAVAVDQGRPWLGHFPVTQGQVLVIDEENAVALLKKRLQKLLRAAQMPEDGSTLQIEFLASAGVNLSDPPCVEALGRVLEEMKPDLVIVDALVRVHRGNENDAGDMARLFGVIRKWITSYGCSFVFCHHHKRPGLMGNDPANMYRGSSEIRAFVDTHLDLRKNRGEEGVFTVEHSKSRYAEPVRPFSVEIVDVGEEGTEICYAGEATNQTKAKLDEACEFIKTLVSDGEWHGRPEILERGRAAELKQHTLDSARKLMIESGELLHEPRGKMAGVRLKQRSDVPDIYIGVGTTKPPSTEIEQDDLQEIRVS